MISKRSNFFSKNNLFKKTFILILTILNINAIYGQIDTMLNDSSIPKDSSLLSYFYSPFYDSTFQGNIPIKLNGRWNIDSLNTLKFKTSQHNCEFKLTKTFPKFSISYWNKSIPLKNKNLISFFNDNIELLKVQQQNNDTFIFYFNDTSFQFNLKRFLNNPLTNSWNYYAYTLKKNTLSFYLNYPNAIRINLPFNSDTINKIIICNNLLPENIDDLYLSSKTFDNSKIISQINKNYYKDSLIDNQILMLSPYEFPIHKVKLNKIKYTIIDTVTVLKNNLKLKIWDYERPDNDKITIFSNYDSLLIKDYSLKKRRKKLKFNIKKNIPNILFFKMENNGLSYINTLAIKLKGHKLNYKRKMATEEGTNLAILFNYISNEELQKRAEIKNSSFVINSDSITIELWDNDIVDKDKIALSINKLFLLQDYMLIKDTLKFRAILHKGLNKLTIYSISKGTHNEFNTASLNIISKGKTINTKRIDLQSSENKNTYIELYYR